MQIAISTEELIIYALVAIVIVLIVWILRLESKIKNIPSIKNNIETANKIAELQKNIKELGEYSLLTTNTIKKIKSELKKSVKGIQTIRFNPFKDGSVGGNQSFATTILDENGNGVILSSLYSREKVSVFAKPVHEWNCEYEMSDEEKQVLEKTKNKK